MDLDGSTRCINLPHCARTTQLKSPLWVTLLVFPLNPETVVWSSDKLLVNRRCCNMCIDVPESRRSGSWVIVAHVSAAPLDRCVYEFVYVSARSQGTDICLY